MTKVTLTLSADHRVVGDEIGGLIPQFTLSSKFLYLFASSFWIMHDELCVNIIFSAVGRFLDVLAGVIKDSRKLLL